MYENGESMGRESAPLALDETGKCREGISDGRVCFGCFAAADDDDGEDGGRGVQ